MAKGTYAVAVVFGMALFAAGCSNKQPQEPNEYQIALKSIPDDLLRQGPVLGPPPGNSVGDLLDDYNDAVSVGSQCTARHAALIRLLAPLVQKAKAPQ
ncbi:hypothetical protein FDG94_gp025 [Pseudomonas phage SM1]|uniref:Lipoprotein n=1 Tax=Pseudomonas phage SM1 TaxID=1772332 RepID=A0A0U3C8L2_9CAUD|nr:hypothetical protein FDG94_gp025 [Pseudomonas phage SM1]UGC97129.1 hypothetical protein [Pseudomonas phage BHU-1]UGV19912.1 hypothetical protein [Pseudomonas phage Pa BHU-15]UIW13648.1 hypothetical protein [Pseudomonas phage Pa BHU-17]WDS62545.1 hypothetical protein UFRH6_119 [Pseudomonas phage UF_RH6]ALT58018.1 hypothetical protein SM1_025 [Pseudomonas phage SM1]